MGEYIYNRDHNGHGLRGFTPDDTGDKFYLEAGYSGIDLADILDKIQEKWPGLSLHDVTIEAEHIHTHCLGYDLYVSGDHTNYLCVSRKAITKDRQTKTFYYISRYDDLDRPTEYYCGENQWMTQTDLDDPKNNRITLRLYENQALARIYGKASEITIRPLEIKD